MTAAGSGNAPLGRVVRLQVQRSRLKPGPARGRAYRPAPITGVDVLRVTADGAVGERGGEEILDVHSADHPESRHRAGRNGLSLMTTAGYERLRARYGPHLVDGIAGESVLVDAPVVLDGGFEGRDLEVLTADGPVRLTRVAICSPCVEFTRFCLGREPDTSVDDEVRAGLDALGGGARGLLAAAAAPGTIRVGDVVRLAGPGPAHGSPPPRHLHGLLGLPE